MADEKTYRDWQGRTRRASQVLSDKKLKPWQKAHLAGGAYAGLALSNLRSKHRHRFLNRISQLNAILAKYPIESFDDYQQIRAADVQEMIATIRMLACPRK